MGDDLFLDNTRVQSPIFIDGVSTYNRQVAFQNQVDVIGIRFYPGGAFPFLRTPLSLLVNQTFMADELALDNLQSVYHQLHDVNSAEEKVDVLEQWLLQRMMRETHNIAPAVETILNTISQAKGQITIKQISTDVAVSQRQLERLFKIQVGITPKHYARIIRVQNARRVIKESRFPTTAEAGYWAGYYDQAHFIREFKQIMGATPKRYAALQ